jgi:hypothetical protein
MLNIFPMNILFLYLSHIFLEVQYIEHKYARKQY